MKAPKVTDLSIPLTNLTVADVRNIVLNTNDDSWAIPYGHLVGSLFSIMNYGYDSPERVTVRELAVHVYNREMYFNARTKNNTTMFHVLLDKLFDSTRAMEGVISKSASFKDVLVPYHDIIGRYNFMPHLRNNPDLQKAWDELGYYQLQEL